MFGNWKPVLDRDICLMSESTTANFFPSFLILIYHLPILVVSRLFGGFELRLDQEFSSVDESRGRRR